MGTRMIHIQQHVIRPSMPRRERDPGPRRLYVTVPATGDEVEGVANDEENSHLPLARNLNHEVASTESPLVAEEGSRSSSPDVDASTVEEARPAQNFRILLPSLARLRSAEHSGTENLSASASESIQTERRQRCVLMLFLVIALLQLWGQYIVTGDPTSLLLALLGSSYVAKLARAFREREEEIERINALGG